MNAFMTGSFLSEQTVEHFGWVLVHFLWQGGAIMAVMWCVMKILNRASAQARYAMACLGLVVMALAPAVTYMQMNGGPATRIAEKAAGGQIDTGMVQPAVENISDITFAPPVKMAPPIAMASVVRQPIEAALPGCVAGWMAGVMGLSLWYLGGWRQTQQLRHKGTRAVSDAVGAKTAEWAKRLGIRRAVRIVESGLVQIPVVIGWLKPVILLPGTALTGLNEAQLQALIAHELAHIKRCDYPVNIAQTLVEILGFYHPAVWWLSRQIRIERENCCDDMAVALLQDRKEYTRALFAMEEIRGQRNKLVVAAAGGELHSRIGRLINGNAISPEKPGWTPIAMALGVMIALTCSFAMTAPACGESGERILQFPADESLGDIFLMVDEPEKYALPFNVFNDIPQWKEHADAKGTVTIPAGKRVRLIVCAAVGEQPEKLAPLKACRADDFYSLTFRPAWSGGKPATDACVPYFRHLTGLRQLDIDDSIITQAGLKGLADMKQLERITLPKKLTNSGFEEVVKMKSLRSIRSQENRITDQAVGLLSELPALEELNLSGVKLTDAGLSYLPNLPHLRFLELGPMKGFTPQGCAYLAQISSLRVLRLCTECCTDEGVEKLMQHPGLDLLDLTWEGNITDKGVGFIARMPKLTKLYLRAKLTDQSLEYLSHNPGFTLLRLSGGYSDAGLAHLGKLTGLKELHINATGNSSLTDRSLAVLSGLQHLERLWTGGAGFTNEGMDQLAKLKELKELLISHCPLVSDDGFQKLARLENLENLNWGGTSQVTFAGLNQFGRHKKLEKLSCREMARGNAALDLAGIDNLTDLRIEMKGKYDQTIRRLKFNESFTADDFKCLKGLTKLDYLQLSGDGIGDQGMANLAGLHNLTTCMLYGQTEITDKGLKALAGLDRLWMLHIHSGRFTDEALDTVGQLKSLEMLELTSDKPFSDPAIEKLKTRIKNFKKLKLSSGDNPPAGQIGAGVPMGGMSTM